MAEEIRIEFTRFSAFYSPLIATMAGGFLKAEGLEPKHSVSAPGKSAVAGLVDGSVHVAQSAPSQSFGALEQGKEPPALHFAQINEKDGFFLAGRSPDPAFAWDKLKDRKVLVDHGGQPMAMFKYACFKRNLDFGAITAVDAGPVDKMIAAFRAGEGDFIHLQGPGPQQLQHDKAGHVVASVGDAIGPCAFSSLAATRAWLASDMAKAFMRAYRKARAWLIATPAAEVARAEAPFFAG
ncbi:MAG TPA: ABC transporter substrate-binding protein, partial [Hyphomicrobiaceae bacterium]